MRYNTRPASTSIDTDELMESFADFVKTPNTSDFAPTPTWNDAVDIVENTPTADVAEVRHGKWLVIENDEDELWKGGGHYECSSCGYGFSFGGYFELDEEPYCPHCGAKMDGERREE